MAKFAEAAEAYDLEEKTFFEAPQSANAYIGYTYGSAAPAYEPAVMPSAEPVPEEQPQQKPHKKPSVRPRVSRAEREGRAALVVMTLFIAAGALLIVGMYARIFVQKNQLSALRSELDRAVMETQMAGKTETEVFTLTEIRDYATLELGMHTPGAGEIITVSAAFGAYTEDYSVPQPSAQTVGFHWFGD